MIVIDLGCKTWGEDESVGVLVERFKPDLFFGFDPLISEGLYRDASATVRVFSGRAAWLYDGFADFTDAGICSGIPAENGTTAGAVPCFNFGSFFHALPDGEIVVKVDIEGGEYPLLMDLCLRGLDAKIALLLGEWHTGEYANGHDEVRPELRCPVEEWH